MRYSALHNLASTFLSLLSSVYKLIISTNEIVRQTAYLFHSFIEMESYFLYGFSYQDIGWDISKEIITYTVYTYKACFPKWVVTCQNPCSSVYLKVKKM
jgi:hypothetical protein